MNFTDQQKSWIILVATILSSGGAVALTSYSGGCKPWLAITAGIVAASTHVVTLLMNPAKLRGDNPLPPPPQPPKP